MKFMTLKYLIRQLPTMLRLQVIFFFHGWIIFKHDLNDYQCGDETYVKVLGKKAYVFFMCDVKKKIITSYRIYMNRDTFSAIDAFYSVLRKFKEIPENLEFVVDGNPIYKAAQQYFQLKRIFSRSHRLLDLRMMILYQRNIVLPSKSLSD